MDEETARFAEWLRSRDVVPTVVALREIAEGFVTRSILDEVEQTEPEVPELHPEVPELTAQDLLAD